MNAQEVAAVVDGIVPVFKAHVTKKVAHLSERIQKVEANAVSKEIAEAMVESAFGDLAELLVNRFATAEAVSV